MSTLAALSLFGSPRRPVSCRGELGVSSASPSSLGSEISLPSFDEILEDLACLGVNHPGAYRNANDKILSIPAGLVIAAALFAILSNEPGLRQEVGETGHLGIAVQKNISPPSSVSSVRAALWTKACLPEAQTAVSPIAALEIDRDTINEFHGIGVQRELRVEGAL
jgi:hypothetical protein